MILDLEDTSRQGRFIPDVTGYNFSVLMPDVFSTKGVLSSSSPFGLSGLGVSRFSNAPTTISGPGVMTVQNLTTGDPSSFKAGDSWKISLSGGPPNLPVYVAAYFRDIPVFYPGQQDLAATIWTGSYQDGSKPIGQTDGSGNWTSGGTFSDAQAGHWDLEYNVGGQSLIGVSLDVYDSAGNLPTTIAQKATGTPYYELATSHVPAQQYTAAQLTAMSQQAPAQQQASTQTNKPNQSVPPTTPITQIPTLPSGTPTKQLLTSSFYGAVGAGGAASDSSGSQIISGIDNTTLALGAAAVVALFFMMGRK